MVSQADSGGVKICFDDMGQGKPALLLMPGWCANRTVFRDLIPGLSQHHRTVALDWRGHGESGFSMGDFGKEGLVEDALAIIRASGAE